MRYRRARPWGACVSVVSVAVLAVAVLVLAGDPAHGQPEADPRAAVELILDSSGSMAADAGSGRSKMQVAKAALREVIGAMPDDGLAVGLRVYGHRVGSADELREEGCRDTELVAPVEPLDGGALQAAVDQFSPSGYTPIGRSLNQAAGDLADLGGDLQQRIVLVSDGVDTCAPPDPCQAAEQLTGQGVDLQVHTIGFQVDAEAREQLICIAEATGGTYRDAPDAAALSDSLRALSLRAYRTYEAIGDPVAGTATPGEAPVLEPGQYVDTLSEGDRRFWRVRAEPGQRVTAYAQVVSGPDVPGSPSQLLVGFVSPEEAEGDFDLRFVCQSQLDVIEGEDTMRPAAASGVQIAPEPDGEGCSQPGTWTFGALYTQLFSAVDVPEVTTELVVRVEGEPVTASPSPTVSPSPTATAAGTPSTTPPATPTPEDPEGGTGGSLLGWLLGVVALPVGGAAGWLLAGSSDGSEADAGAGS